MWEIFSRRFYYFKGDFNNQDLYPQLKDFLAKVDRDHSTQQNYFYYLATALQLFLAHRGEAGGRGIDGTD